MWMRRATAIERRATLLHVIKALEQTEDKLRNTNYCLITYSKLFLNPGEGFYMIHQKCGSTGFYGPVDTVHMLTNDETYTHTDSVLYDMGSQSTEQYPVSADLQIRFSMVIDDTADFYRQQKEFFRNTGSKKVSDRMANTKAIDSLFDMDLADSLIRQNLIAEYVTTPYGFGFISGNKNKIAFARRVKDSTALAASSYSIPVFQDNKFLPSYRLALVFRDGLYPVNYWIFISIFIIILLTVCFYVFVRLHLDQARLSEMKSDFINNMSHEFNTPVSNISLAIEMLHENDTEVDKDKLKKILGIISAESSRLKNNIDKSLQSAAVDRGEIHFHKEEIDLVAVIKTILSSYQLQCEQLGGKIEFIHPEQLIVKVDETHLLNCVCNLLDNAIKYRQAVPVITVILKDDSRYVRLIVADNGKGMSGETQKHIFEKFYRAHEGNVHNTKGFGLGLSYVKGIIDAHNGKISVLSRHGTGTTFTIILPK